MVIRARPFLNLAVAASALPVAGLLAGPLLAAGVPAGTIIESTASASYDDGGTPGSATSNTVQVRVDEVLGSAAATLDSGPQAVQPGTAVLRFVVSNTGNGTETLALEVVASVAGNDFDAVPDAIAIDSNGNGAYDPGIDQVLPAPAALMNVPADTAQTVFVIVSIPASLADGARSTANLVARTATGSGAPGTVIAGAGDSGVDAVVGASGGSAIAASTMIASASTVTLVKSATIADPFGGSSAIPGAIITYAIVAQVGGSAAVEALRINDPIPAGTAYRPATLQLDGVPLTDAAGDDAGEASASAITVDLGTVAGGVSRTISFAVTIAETGE